MRIRRKTKEEVLKAVENVEVIEKVSAESSEECAEEISEEISEEATQEVLEEISEETTQEVSEAILEEELKEISKEIAAETSVEEAMEDISAEIAEALAEETPEDVSETAQEATSEETPEAASEATPEEASEEMPEESLESGAEEIPGENDSTETQDEATEEKKAKKINKKVIIIIAAVVAVLVAAYLGVAFYFSNYFLMGTSVNGVACTGMTVKEVKNILQSQVEEYSLTIEEKDGVTEEIKGVDIGIQYIGADIIEDAFEKQNSYTWIVSLFKENNMKVDVDFKYDAEKLDEAIGQLSCLKEENQVAPVSATPVYKEGVFEIQEEVYGTQIDSEQLYATIRSTVDAMENTVNLEEKDCYVLPKYTKDSTEVIAAKDELNKYLEASITYSLDGTNVTVDKTMIVNWISVDADMTAVINAEQVRAFTDSLGTTYNTPNGAGEITTPNGKVTSVPNGRLGRIVGSAAECDQLMNEIRTGTQTTREPILSQQATPEGTTRWGTTYIEVDIAQQHMWYVVDGTSVFESDIITGLAGKMDTPSGIFTVLEKLSPKVLTGNIVPATGKPEYVTPVNYWVRVTWSGVGFHDCTWHSVFGGEIYKTAGSHGCINMPPEAAATFYGLVNVGCPIVIHY